jgi:site-specific DNA recombinase
MRAVIYARYSTDLQSVSSIEDQVRLCHERLERDGHELVKVYSDRAVSGATLLRPGIQLLMQDATRGAFDRVYAEALDRVSRDQEDAAGFFKRMAFAEVTIVTLAEGEISELHVGLKGTMTRSSSKTLPRRRGAGCRVAFCKGCRVEVSATATTWLRERLVAAALTRVRQKWCKPSFATLPRD